RVAEAVAREFRQRRLQVDAVGLVDDEQGRLGQLAQPAQDLVVERGSAFAAIDHEQDQVGLLRGGARLPRGGAGQALVLAGDAAGIDQHERTPLDQPADAVVAVAGDAGLVVDQRVAGAGQRVEQRGLADVGAPDQGDEGQHGSTFARGRGFLSHETRRPRQGSRGRRWVPARRPACSAAYWMENAASWPSVVCTTTTSSATAGWPAIAPPMLARAAKAPSLRRSQCTTPSRSPTTA